MKYLSIGAAVAIFAALLLASPGAWAKDCRENTGGACVGHWRCDSSDAQKVCTDVIKRSGMECVCQRATSRTIDGDDGRDRWSVYQWREYCRHHRDERRCERYLDDGDHDRDQWGEDRWREWCRHHRDEDRRCERYRDDGDHDRDQWGEDRWREWCRHHRDEDRRCERHRDDGDEDRSGWSDHQWREWCRDHRSEHGLCARWNRD